MWVVVDSFVRKEYVNGRWFGYALFEDQETGVQQEISFKFIEEPAGTDVSTMAQSWLEQANYTPPEE